MDVSIRKQALRHAAKVAFGTLMVPLGCGGVTQDTADAQADAKTSKDSSSTGDSSVQQDAQDDQTPIDDGGSWGDGSLACTGPVDVDAGNVSSQAFQCCLGVVEQITGDSGFVVADAGEVTGDPSIDNCCKAIIAHVDYNTSDYSAASQVLPTCCRALGYPSGPACTPWGPPTPPAMVEGLALEVA